MVVVSQPWMMVALGCVLVSAFITFFWGKDFYAPRLFYLFPNTRDEKWPHWVCGILLTAAMVIWVVLTIVNHTTISNDIWSFITVTALSVVLLYVAQIIYLFLVVFFVALIVGIWWIFAKCIIRD